MNVGQLILGGRQKPGPSNMLRPPEVHVHVESAPARRPAAAHWAIKKALLALFRRPLLSRKSANGGADALNQIAKEVPLNKKVCYLNTEDAPKWKDYMEVMAASLGIPADKFDKFDCFNGEFPPRDALARGDYVGVLINGSHYSAKDSALAWLPELFETLRFCAALEHLNMVGICFGCQALAVALGGDVGPNPDGSFEFGRCEVTLATKAQLDCAMPACACQIISHKGKMQLLESHGEQVTKLPPGAKCLGCSNVTPNELYVAGQHRNVLGCQSHPEFDDSLLKERIEPALREKQRLAPDFQYASECTSDQLLGRRLLRHWILRER